MITDTYYATTIIDPDPAGVSMPEVKLVPKETGVIDVVNEFMWTASPKIDKFSKVPVLYLTERKQTLNSLVASAAYYLNATSQALKDTAIGAAPGAAAIAQSSLQGLTDIPLVTPPLIDSMITKLVGMIPTGPAASKAVEDAIKEIQKFTGSDSDRALLKFLPAYFGIYQTQPTGFNYAIPYFNDDSGFNITNSWAETAPAGKGYTATALAKIVGETATGVSKAFNIAQPGTFIETPKYFQYDATAKTITVKFPLYNTISRGIGNTVADKLPYQQNYEFLWILAYQNRPFRKSFSIVGPGKLYTLYIPGMEFFPYCFIESLNIDFQGTRRNLKVRIPYAYDLAAGKSAEVTTSIPEAYMVEIKLKSLIANVNNMMLQEQFNKIRVSSK